MRNELLGAMIHCQLVPVELHGRQLDHAHNANYQEHLGPCAIYGGPRDSPMDTTR
jgi:hypothetical protein